MLRERNGRDENKRNIIACKRMEALRGTNIQKEKGYRKKRNWVIT